MSDVQYNLQFEKLCKVLQLGEIVDGPEAISGGLLHRMYAVKTVQGKYAVKALNPKIMLRPPAMGHIIHSEQIAAIASRYISALPAKRFNDASIKEVDKQFYLIFDWVDGKSLKADEIRVEHCEKIGSILADIHMIDFAELDIHHDCTSSQELIDWNYYLKKGKEDSAVWADLLLGIIKKLYDWNDEANKSEKELESNVVISHRDLDSKNVMWNKDNPIIIDWESAGYINPMEDLIETAVYWSEIELGSISKEKFLAFINGYKKKHNKLQADWRMILYNGFLNKLDWLEYSLKRSLWIDCTDEAEQKMGTKQVIETIKAVEGYADMIPTLEEWLKSE